MKAAEHKTIQFLDEFPYSGQNLGIREVSAKAHNRTELMEQFMVLLRIWEEEGDLYCNQSFIEAFRPHPHPS